MEKGTARQKSAQSNLRIHRLTTSGKTSVWLKIGNKYTFLSKGPWGETGMQLKPQPLQHIYQRIGEGTRTVCSTLPHPTRI